MKYINKIGIELEGGWNSRPTGLKHDGSVIFKSYKVIPNPDGHDKVEFSKSPNICGESVSKPVPSLVKAKSFIKKNNPQFINETCGTHFHISLKSEEDYLKLTSKKFNTHFIKTMREWGHKNCPDNTEFWNRLEGRNKYCKKEFIPGRQIHWTTKSGAPRYTQLNYCYSLHGTLECRLFPAFDDPALTAKALEALINCINNFLNKERESPITAMMRTYKTRLKHTIGNF